MTADPVLNLAPTIMDPQRWNRYAYVRNNPLRFVDPTGADPGDLLEELADYGNGVSRGIVATATLGTAPGSTPQTGDSTLNLLGQAMGSLGVGLVGVSGGGAEALATLPAALTGEGAVVPAAGAVVAVTTAISTTVNLGKVGISMMGGSEGGGKQFKEPKAGQSGKEGAKDIPSWAAGEKPLKGETGDKYARRLLDTKYGEGSYKTGADSEYSKLKKYADRHFQ